MAEKKHHLFHHKEEEPVEAVSYTEATYGSSDGGYTASSETVVVGEDFAKEQKHHKHLEELGGLGAVAAGTFALYEKHEVKKDPEHAHRHKIEEEIAAAAVVGAGGFAFHEKHEKKEAHKEEDKAEGKHHHLF